MRAADMTRRYTRHSPPYLREDPEPKFRERMLKFLDAMGVGVQVKGYTAFAGIPILTTTHLTTEMLDRLVCWQIEKFWSDRARREANRQALTSWHAGGPDPDYRREDREERRRLDREYPMAAE